MLDIRYKKIETKFIYPFTTAHGLKTHQSALLIAIQCNGYMGIGEAPAIHYYQVSVEGMIEALLDKINILERYAFTEPERFWHFCHHLFPDHSFLVCALDMAYWNMYAQCKRNTISSLWALQHLPKVKALPLTDYTIGIDLPDMMLKKMLANPSPIYKIKVSSESDIATLHLLRKHTDAVFRIDANASWNLEIAERILPQLHALQIEFIEQPLAIDALHDMPTLRKMTSIPFIADESCVHEQDVAICAPYFDGINIKLTKCGGITPAVRMIEEARKYGLKVMMGCMNETEPGTEAIAHFIPWLDYLDADGPLLLEVPELKKIRYEYGKIILNA